MLHALGLLRALGHPVVDAADVELEADFVLHGLRIVETHLLEALATLTLAAVSHHDVIEGHVGSAAAGQTNSHHVIEPLTACGPEVETSRPGRPKKSADSTQTNGLAEAGNEGWKGVRPQFPGKGARARPPPCKSMGNGAALAPFP